MINQEKIRLMTRLAILEKQHGKQIRKAENAFRIDLLTNPVWKMGFFVSLIFAAVAGVLAVVNINMLLDAFASGKLKNLIMVALIAYGSILLITIVIASVRAYGSYRRSVYYQRQYHSLLEKIRRFEPERRSSSSRYAQDGRIGEPQRAGRKAPDPSDDEEWEDEPDIQERDDGRRKRSDLDYRHMQTLEFEDDEYSYYVEATPKRGGRRG